MEDVKDNLSTENKRYYMSHSEYLYSEKEQEKLKKIGVEIDFNKRIKLRQLVCATDMLNARAAVTSQLERNGEFLVLKCRIDYLIIGD